jgi:hypothetical protein
MRSLWFEPSLKSKLLLLLVDLIIISGGIALVF